eukprot:5998127-Pyramimonas_sp.AAC.1
MSKAENIQKANCQPLPIDAPTSAMLNQVVCLGGGLVGFVARAHASVGLARQTGTADVCLVPS